ncbi:Delta(24)-sterol C-methyltransferase [Paramarasmius palmivorus]|uniref:Delta(24)-sterol C-methyltransferase n=1 Tax=Paramarasmius palmivorus TaxID=297713 RepID=A0AAW0CNH8_9AGAR
MVALAHLELPAVSGQLAFDTFFWSAVAVSCLVALYCWLPSGQAEGRVNDRLAKYTKFWRKDLEQDTERDQETRLEEYQDVVNGYYDGATILYEWAWSKKFHFGRFFKGEGFEAALLRHEHYLASQMGIRPGMRVLDVGCGIGDPARCIARFTGATVVGINNNDFQLGRARKYTKEAGLEGQVSFVKGDFMKLVETFGENSFDAVYGIEATCHAPNFEGIYGQIQRVLKPGGVFGVYEWAMTESWDPSIPEHKLCSSGIEFSCGIPEMRPLSKVKEALHNVGFKIEYAADLADNQDEVPWYYPLEGDINKAQTAWDVLMCWRISRSGRLVSHTFMRALEAVRLLPKGTCAVVDSMTVALSALVQGGQQKIFTPMFLAVCRKQ